MHPIIVLTIFFTCTQTMAYHIPNDMLVEYVNKRREKQQSRRLNSVSAPKFEQFLEKNAAQIASIRKSKGEKSPIAEKFLEAKKIDASHEAKEQYRKLLTARSGHQVTEVHVTNSDIDNNQELSEDHKPGNTNIGFQPGLKPAQQKIESSISKLYMEVKKIAEWCKYFKVQVDNAKNFDEAVKIELRSVNSKLKFFEDKFSY